MNIVVMRPGAIGDCLLVFPILAALRIKYAHAHPHITFIGQPLVLPFAKDWGLADETYSDLDFQWNDLVSEAGIQQTAFLDRARDADLFIFWWWFRDAEEPILAKQSLLNAGAKEVIAASGFPRADTTTHIVNYLAGPLGLHNLQPEYIAPLHARQNSSPLTHPPIAIHIGASDTMRVWPAASYATVINRLLRLGHSILLLVGPSDTEQFNNIHRRLSSPSRADQLMVLKNAPLSEVANRLKQCACFLGNDSGMAHLASMLGIPTIVLFLPRHVRYTRPIGPRVEVLQAEPLKRISVNTVLEKVMYAAGK
jgi:heptosyltransferase-3